MANDVRKRTLNENDITWVSTISESRYPAYSSCINTWNKLPGRKIMFAEGDFKTIDSIDLINFKDIIFNDCRWLSKKRPYKAYKAPYKRSYVEPAGIQDTTCSFGMRMSRTTDDTTVTPQQIKMKQRTQKNITAPMEGARLNELENARTTQRRTSPRAREREREGTRHQTGQHLTAKWHSRLTNITHDKRQKQIKRVQSTWRTTQQQTKQPKTRHTGK